MSPLDTQQEEYENGFYRLGDIPKDLRKYFEPKPLFDFETIAKELFRVTKAGGVVVWVVGDATINGSETLTSFRQAIKFQEIGFNVETMIYQKVAGATGSNNYYWQSFEYMFVFSKGSPKTHNLIADRKNVTSARTKTGAVGHRHENGDKKGYRQIVRKEYGIRNNIWNFNAGALVDTTHPAAFPEQLAQDHILSWSNEGDTVLDCFAGSGTTLKMAKMLSRHYIGIEISPEYVSLAERRLLATPVPLFGQGRGLTQRTPDLWDSAPLQSFSTLKANPLAEHLSTPPTSG